MVTLEIPRRAFTVVDEEGKFVHTGRGADIYVGFGQPDERTKELTGKKCLKIHISVSYTHLTFLCRLQLMKA